MSVFILKLIALSAMLLDHMQGSFPNTFPIVFGWIGRIAIPIFMFCVVQGLIHTSNRKKYLLRIYIGSANMTIGSVILQTCFSDAGFRIADNIFATLFLLAVMISLATCKLPTKRKVILWVGFALLQVIGYLIISRLQDVSENAANLASGLIPNIVRNEGSFIFLALGILFYIFRNNRLKFALMYVVFCALMFVNSALTGLTVQNLFYENYQWMMIIALPMMLAYNGKKGKGLKYFFYAFYPLHIWILFIIAYLIQRKV